MYVCRHVCGCVWTTCEVYDLCCPLAPWSFSPGCSIGSLIHWNLSYWRSMYTKIHVQHTWHCMLPFICFPFKNSAERSSHQKNAACVVFLKNCRSVLQHLLLMPEFLSISGTNKVLHVCVHASWCSSAGRVWYPSLYSYCMRIFRWFPKQLIF